MPSRPESVHTGPATAGISPTEFTGYQVWEARSVPDNSIVGYLVTRPDEIHNPIGFVYTDNGSEEEEAFALACRASQDADALILDDTPLARIDLRAFGTPGSRLPMPPFLYGLKYRAVYHAALNGTPDRKPIDGPAREFSAYCRFMLDRLSKSHPWPGTYATSAHMENGDKWGEAEHLARHMVAFFGAENDCVPEMLDCLKRDDGEDWPPAPRDVEHALECFYLQPVNEQQAVLNGWKPDQHGRIRHRLIERAHTHSIQRVLNIEPEPTGEMFCNFETMPRDNNPVSVQILEGAKLDEVLAALNHLIEFLPANWSKVITDPMATNRETNEKAREGGAR